MREDDLFTVKTDKLHLKAINTDDCFRMIYFGDYMKQKEEKKLYDEITDLNGLKSMVEKFINDYNSSAKIPLDLVILASKLIYIIFEIKLNK
jgi:hypothetical protein